MSEPFSTDMYRTRGYQLTVGLEVADLRAPALLGDPRSLRARIGSTMPLPPNQRPLERPRKTWK
jgi:hypothetical protein